VRPLAQINRVTLINRRVHVHAARIIVELSIRLGNSNNWRDQWGRPYLKGMKIIPINVSVDSNVSKE